MPPEQPNQTMRIAYLDGLRGLAIMLVVFYHAYARWVAVVPYGRALEDFPLFKYGNFGVQLFFLISGFVIFLTLERCQSFGEFIYKRWLRLFPAMLVCSLLVYATAEWLPERPKGLPTLRDLIPGLSFIEPSWWAAILGGQQGQLEGSFWSLYVEFKFYVLAGLLYFRFGVGGALKVLVPLALLAKLTAYFVIEGRSPASVVLLRDVLDELSLAHFGWFCAGACFYYFKKEQRRTWLLGGLVLGICFAVDGYFDRSLARLMIVLVFALAMTSGLVQQLLSLRVALTLGAVSYPLYLIHEQAMIALIVKLGQPPIGVTGVGIPVLVVGMLVLLAYVIAIYVEPWLKRLIANGLSKGARLITVARQI